MSGIWKHAKIGAVCEVVAGQSPEGEFYNRRGEGLPFYQGKKEFQAKTIGPPTMWTYKVTKIALPRDVLMSVRAPVGPVNFATEKSCIGRGLAAIRASDKVDPNFLFYFLLSKEGEIVGNEGAVFSSLNKKQIEEIQIPLPSLPEQKRVVAILDGALEGIDTAVANAKKNLVNARELFDSYLTTVFTRHDAGWMRRRLSTLCEKITVGHVGSMSSRYKGSGVPFLRSQNIRPFELAMESVVFIDEQFHLELNKSRLRPGDIAVVRTGYPGTAAVIPPELEDANCSDLVIIRPGLEVNPHYLTAFFNSAFGKKLVLGKLVGAAQKHFNIGAAREVLLHYPSFQRQEQIVSELSGFRTETERLHSLCQRKIAALGQLKQAILQKAFAGELSALPAEVMPEAAE